MICLQSLPFNFVESEGFINLMKVVSPKYTVPNRKYFSDKLVPIYYNKATKKLQDRLDSCPSMAITTDIWTSKGGHDYISITSHFIDTNFERNHLVLEVIGFEGPNHTAKSIANNLNESFLKWNIQAKISAIVSDNAANMKAAMRELSIAHIGCAAHSLQLVRCKLFNFCV